jgi:hypothetical protein
MEQVPNLLHPVRDSESHPVLKPTHTHNHTGGIRTDGTCPRCNSYAETLADDMDQYEPDYEITLTHNEEPVIPILNWSNETLIEWRPES